MTCAAGEMAKLLDLPASTLGQYDKGGRYHVSYGTAPHPSRLWRATLSQERVF